MRKVGAGVAILVTFAVAASALAGAAYPTTIRIGILLPLTGPFAAVAETQRNGAMLAIEQVSERGGLRMPWGRVRVEAVADDEAKLDVGVRRFRYLVDQGVKGVVGQTWAPLIYAINAVVKREPIPYFPVAVMAKEAFEKGKLAETTFAVAGNPWTVGYVVAKGIPPEALKDVYAMHYFYYDLERFLITSLQPCVVQAGEGAPLTYPGSKPHLGGAKERPNNFFRAFVPTVGSGRPCLHLVLPARILLRRGCAFIMPTIFRLLPRG